MERWDQLYTGGYRFCFGDGAFKPSLFRRRFSRDYSAGLIAPLGQVSAQEPQSRQAPASMT